MIESNNPSIGCIPHNNFSHFLTSGELAAGLTRTVIQMRLEQKISSQSELTELRVGSPGSLHIGLNGLGPLNWLGKKLVFRHVR